MAEYDQILYLDDKIEITKFATMLGVSPILLYQEKQKGRWGDPEMPFSDMTYREAFIAYRKAMTHSVEEKLLKAQKAHEEKLLKLEQEKEVKIAKAKIKAGALGDDMDDTMHPLMKKKLEQDIKLNRAREVQAWLKIAEDKQIFLNSIELVRLLEPFIHVIKNVLVSIGTEFPETASKIDTCMKNLYDFGEKLLEQANTDEEHFIDEMLEKDIEDELLELTFVPEARNDL